MLPPAHANATLTYRIHESGGWVHSICAGGREVVYRVFAAYRDERWGTPTPEVTRLSSPNGGDRFVADYRQAGYGLSSMFDVAGDENEVRVEYEATVSTPLRRNRLGVCVLFPATLAGHPMTVRHTDGTEESHPFPTLIAPHQPCTDIAAITFSIPEGTVTVELEGEVFEMEDQRNWTDFSYKVYGTPLALPVPVELEAGRRIRQRVTVTIRPVDGYDRGGAAALSRTKTASNESPPHSVTASLPRIGTRACGDLSGASGQWHRTFDYVRRDLGHSDMAREPDPDEHRAAHESAAHGDPGVASGVDTVWYLWDASAEEARSWRDRAAAGDRVVVADSVSARLSPVEGGPTLSGTDGSFAELNRERPSASRNGPIVFTLSPQVHDTDNEAVIDNLFGIRAAVESARSIYPAIPIGIGLLELTPHFNPAAGDRGSNRVHRRTDERLSSGFGLAWLLGALCELTASGVASVTMLDSSGEHGFIRDERIIPAAHLLFDLVSMGLIRGLASGGPMRDVEIAVPPVGGQVRYSMRYRSPDRKRRYTVAANLAPETWVFDPSGDAAASRAEDPEGPLRDRGDMHYRVIDRGASTVDLASFVAERERLTRLLEPGASITLPPCAYLWLREEGV